MTDDQPAFPPFDPLIRDNPSSRDAAERHRVGPYRGASEPRDALIARRRALAAQLEDADRVAASRETLTQRIASADEVLRRRTAKMLEDLTIPTPCREKWDRMEGSGAVRRCGRCDRDVHDLARMTSREIDALFARRGPTPCVRLRRRPDGTVVTASCPAPRAPKILRAAGTVALSVLAGGGAGMLFAEGQGAPVHVAPPERSASVEPLAPPVDVEALAADTPLSEHEGAEPPDDGTFMGAALRPSTYAEVTSADLDAGITSIGPHTWELDRDLAARLLAEPPRTRAARVIPHEEGGRVVGVRLFGVRRSSPLGRLGLRNGDTLIDVNGFSMGSPDAALEAYARLRDTDRIYVSIERRGRPLTLTYVLTTLPLADAPPAARWPDSLFTEDELDAGIARRGPTTWRLSPSVVDRLAGSAPSANGVMRLIPHEVDGRVVGLKAFGIHEGRLLHRLGLRNGDLLVAVNGRGLASPDDALETYQSFRSVDRIHLAIERRGTPRILTYLLGDPT